MSKIKKNIKSLKGFTLLELIVVIAIISVLLMIIVPNMTDYIRTSRIREANDQAQQIYMATQDYLNSLQTRGADVTQYFGDKQGSVCRLGVDFSVNKGHTCTSGDGKKICENDIECVGADNYNGSTALGSENLSTAKGKYLEAARSICANLSGDFEGAWYVEVYPETYTVKFALYSGEKNDCSTCSTSYDWDAVSVIAQQPYKSMFKTSNTEASGTISVHGGGRGIRYAASQETCYNKGYETAYVGQYPIPAPTA